MKVIGLTGGIGTGKSTAAAYLVKKGFAHIDADAISRELTADGNPMLAELNSIFGPEGELGEAGQEILTAGGGLDRKALAALVFSDDAKRSRLDQLMHGAIVERIDRRIQELQQSQPAQQFRSPQPSRLFRFSQPPAGVSETPDPLDPSKVPQADAFAGILLDAPLLFEAGLDSRCDRVLLLVADETVRIHRVCSRDGVTPREARNRINSQMSDAEKGRLADMVLDNSGTRQALYKKLDAWLASLCR